MKRGRKQKFNYDSDDFYQQVYILSAQGCTYKEIAQKIGLSQTVFSKMMNGKYRHWTKEENKERCERIRVAIENGGLKVRALVRSTLFRFAFGGIILHTTIRKYLVIKGADGNIIIKKEVITKVFGRELPPNIKLLEKLLYHYDPEWRQIENLKSKKMKGSVHEFSSNEEWIKAKINISVESQSSN